MKKIQLILSNRTLPCPEIEIIILIFMNIELDKFMQDAIE